MRWLRLFSFDKKLGYAPSVQNSRSQPLFTSPVLDVTGYSPLRYKIIWILLCVCFASLIYRAAKVQIFTPGIILEKAEERMMRDVEESAARGKLTDRHGNVLASSVEVAAIYFSPRAYREELAQRKSRKKLKQREPEVDQAEIAKLLAVDLDDIKERFAEAKGDYVLKRGVEWKVSDQLMALNVPGLYRRKEFKRLYPGGEAVAQLIGVTDEATGSGVEGLELTLERDLQGAVGKRRVLRDQLGRTIETLEETSKPKPGLDKRLSIDSQVQFHAFRILKEHIGIHKARAGSVVVADVRTGEVLALANYPSFDPGNRQGVGIESLRNRAVADMFEPGSTMKPFTVALALETKRVTPQTQINTSPGRLQMAGFTISDHHNYGTISIEQIIQKSSNIGTVRMAEKMPAREMWELYTRLGFGQRPQIEAPGAASGRLRPYKAWRAVEQATMSYGYGLSASIVQLARAYTAFGTDGEVVPLTLLATDTRAQGVRVISPRVAQEMRQMLAMATRKGGTAPAAQPQGYSVGGKTGTARKQVGKSYVEGKYRTFFVGLAPITDPRVVVAVMIDEPTSGSYFAGLVAAPAFAAIVENVLRSLGVAPDVPVKPDLSVAAVEESN